MVFEMSSAENGCASSEDLAARKNIKTTVIDNEPLKIKLKITKKEVADVKTKRRISAGVNGEDKMNKDLVEERLPKMKDPKMKLRAKSEGEGKKEESEENENRKRKELVTEEEKPTRKRIKVRHVDEIYDDGPRRRSKRVETESLVVEKSKEVMEVRETQGSFCWACHKDGSVVKCDTCPRVFHLKCVSLTKDPSKDWICPECSLVLHAEKISTRSEAMKSLSLDQLCTLLNFAIGRMKNVPESQAFWKPVDPKEVPFYNKYITNPMDLNLLESNMKAKMYGSPQAFLADAKWLLHNSIIFNTTQSPLTATARLLVKICRQEMGEIENCPDCYLNAHTKEDWFIEVCRKPHILIWARLKGFPFWPAKAMSTNLKTQQVDARFFGAHDKAWVPVKECYLYSKNSPQVINKKRTDLDDAFLETERYIKKIRQKFGTFSYAPDKTPFLPEMYDKQLQILIPNYKEFMKKKRKSGTVSPENSSIEKPVQNGKKTDTPKIKLKRTLTEESPKPSNSVCEVNDYALEEKVLGDEKSTPEDEVVGSLEMFDTPKKREEETDDDYSVNLEEETSSNIPEHGYSQRADNSEDVQSSNLEVEEVTVELSANDKMVQAEEVKPTEEDQDSENQCVAESSDRTAATNKTVEKVSSPKGSNDQCEVSSTSIDLKVVESLDRESVEQTDPVPEAEAKPTTEATTKTQPTSSQDVEKSCEEKSNEVSRKDESLKSFVNLSCDQKQKILAEAKLLANIDEMTASGKQILLNKLGLDASQVDIEQMAQENRQILETLTKKCQNEKKTVEEVTIKNEDFEQYLIEEGSDRIEFEEEPPPPPKCGSIKVKDFQTLSKGKNNAPNLGKTSSEPMLKIKNIQSLRDFQQLKEPKRKKSSEDSLKKYNLDPVIKLPKYNPNDKSMEKLNRKLRLSDDVSLVMVDGEKKSDVEVVKSEPAKAKKIAKPPRARKSMSNQTKLPVETPKTVNVISVDTEHSTAQKNLLKSLCLEEKKSDDSGRKTVLLTTSDKGIQNVNMKNKNESNLKKQIQEVTIEAVKDTGKECLPEQNNRMAVVADSHLIVTNNGPAIVTNQSGPNLALTQNNLGQLSLVHLSNLTSGIQTNFINLTNETIGFNNTIGTVYATPGFNPEFPTSSGSLILSQSISAPSVPSGTASPTQKGNKTGADTIKVPLNRATSGKPSSGISVKSPASLGLIASQPSKLPPVVSIQGDGGPLVEGIGPVTSELNSHSIKMAEYMRNVIESLLKDLSNQGSLEAKYKLLTLEMEKLQWKHQQEIMELKHHSERSLLELRNTLESEKQKCLGELRAQLDSQYQKTISETKRKQWCANCGKEALFYCCWNTSYCDYPCQQQHWPGHMSTCAQLGNNAMGNSSGSQLQGKTSGVKYQNTGYAPSMSRGGGGSSSGSHSGGAFAASRAIPTVKGQPQNRRSNDSTNPHLPLNITIRPQNYFM